MISRTRRAARVGRDGGVQARPGRRPAARASRRSHGGSGGLRLRFATIDRPRASACSSSRARWSATPEIAGVDVAPAQLLGRDLLAGRGLHERRPAQEDRAGALDDDGLVAHRRDIRAAGRAAAHDQRDLRDAGGRHAGLVVEDPAEVLAVREDLGLEGQERAAGVDEVDAGQPVLERDLLGAQVLLDGDRVVGAALDRRVIGDDDALVPSTRPMPVTIPAEGASSSYRPSAASGRVEGTMFVVVANDATVKGGTYYPLTVKKHLGRPGDRARSTGCRACTLRRLRWGGGGGGGEVK